MQALDKKRIVGVNDDEDPPVPIPNTVVKLVGAENTWLATTREDRTTPTLSSFFISKICSFRKNGLLVCSWQHD